MSLWRVLDRRVKSPSVERRIDLLGTARKMNQGVLQNFYSKGANHFLSKKDSVCMRSFPLFFVGWKGHSV